MAVLREIRNRARQITPPVIGACIAGYFAFHVIEGNRGLLAWLSVKQELAQAEATAAELAASRAALERRIGLLRPDHLDPDMLDERAHAVLNYGRDDELIILLPEPGAAAR